MFLELKHSKTATKKEILQLVDILHTLFWHNMFHICFHIFQKILLIYKNMFWE